MSTEPFLSKYLSAKAVKLGIPLSGTFELSPCCNFDCRMCYVRKSREEVEAAGGEIDGDTWLRIGKECRDAEMLFLLLTGGEPFLYKDFKKVYLGLKEMGFMISLNSNGSLIDEEMVEFLKQNPPTRINITLYGGSRETYGRLCNNPDGFDKTLRAVKLLKDAGISVKLNLSVTPYNHNDIKKIYDISNDNQVFVQPASYMFPQIRKNAANIGICDRFTPEEAGRCSVEIDKIRLTEKQFIERAEGFEKGILKHDVRDDESGCEKSEKIRCRAGKCAFWISWNGDITPCGLMNEPKHNVFTEGFLNAWEKIKEDTEKLYMPAKCTSCKNRNLCDVCASAVMAETGGLDEAPDYLCRMTDEKIRYMEQEYQKLVKEGKVNNEDKEGVH